MLIKIFKVFYIHLVRWHSTRTSLNSIEGHLHDLLCDLFHDFFILDMVHFMYTLPLRHVKVMANMRIRYLTCSCTTHFRLVYSNEQRKSRTWTSTTFHGRTNLMVKLTVQQQRDCSVNLSNNKQRRPVSPYDGYLLVNLSSQKFCWYQRWLWSTIYK